DIDLFLLWDLLTRIKDPAWNVQILADTNQVKSSNGLIIPTHNRISAANASDVILFGNGLGVRPKIKDDKYLSIFQLDPSRQLIGSMCSGALILAALGLLKGKKATTYPSAKSLLEEYEVAVVEKPFVREGNIATAAGCLSAQYLASWVIEKYFGESVSDAVIKSIQPIGEGLFFADRDIEKKISEACIVYK
ncbi:MAG: DJ-1/PfpI family protein, partial [Bdellovibrio sp.]